MSQGSGNLPITASEPLEELLQQVTNRERELKATIRDLRKKKRFNTARIAAFRTALFFFAIFFMALTTVYFWQDTPQFIRIGGVVAYLLATMALVAVSAADGALGFLTVFAPMSYMYPLHLESMKSDYKMIIQVALSKYRRALPEASRLLRIEADELDERRALLSGVIEKTGLLPLLLAGNIGTLGLVTSGSAAKDAIATSDLWPSISAAGFVLVLANVSMKQYSMTLRRYASCFERAILLMDQVPPTSNAQPAVELNLNRLENEVMGHSREHDVRNDAPCDGALGRLADLGVGHGPEPTGPLPQHG